MVPNQTVCHSSRLVALLPLLLVWSLSFNDCQFIPNVTSLL